MAANSDEDERAESRRILERVSREAESGGRSAIDRAAMSGGLTDTDAYLAEWRRGQPEACGDDIEAEADAAVDALEAAYPPERLRELVRAGGRSSPGDA